MASLYINPTSGNDTTGNGSLATPYKTIAKCEAVGTLGDEVIIIDGNHTLTATDTVTCTKIRTIRGQSGDPRACVINGNAYTYGIALTCSTTGGVYVIKDFTYKYGVAGGFCFMAAQNGSFTMQNMIIDYFKASNVVAGICGIGATGMTVNITRNIFARYQGIPSGTVGAWIGAESASTTGSTINITNNTIYFDATSLGNTNRGLVWHNSGTHTGTVYNFKNNIIMSEMAPAITALSMNTPIVCNNMNNDYYTTGGAITQTAGTATFNTSGGIAANPLFVDKANNDFRLQTQPTASPCINAGTIV